MNIGIQQFINNSTVSKFDTANILSAEVQLNIAYENVNIAIDSAIQYFDIINNVIDLQNTATVFKSYECMAVIKAVAGCEHLAYSCEGFFSDMFEKIKKAIQWIWNKIKEFFTWLKIKLKSLFGGGKKIALTHTTFLMALEYPKLNQKLEYPIPAAIINGSQTTKDKFEELVRKAGSGDTSYKDMTDIEETEKTWLGKVRKERAMRDCAVEELVALATTMEIQNFRSIYPSGRVASKDQSLVSFISGALDRLERAGIRNGDEIDRAVGATLVQPIHDNKSLVEENESGELNIHDVAVSVPDIVNMMRNVVTSLQSKLEGLISSYKSSLDKATKEMDSTDDYESKKKIYSYTEGIPEGMRLAKGMLRYVMDISRKYTQGLLDLKSKLISRMIDHMAETYSK